MTWPSQVNAESSFLISSKVSMSMTRVRRAFASSLRFGSRRFEMNIALHSECARMFVSSFSEESGRTGTVTLPKGTQENIATVQFGMFWE